MKPKTFLKILALVATLVGFNWLLNELGSFVKGYIGVSTYYIIVAVLLLFAFLMLHKHIFKVMGISD